MSASGSILTLKLRAYVTRVPKTGVSEVLQKRTDFLKITKEFIFKTLFSKRHLQHRQHFNVYLHITLISLHRIFSFIVTKLVFRANSPFSCLIVRDFLFKWRWFHMSHFAYACKMRCPLNLVLENSEYLWFY